MTGYREAGVDIDAGNEAVRLIKGSVKSTHSKMVVNDLGAFGGLYSLAEISKMKEPLLVSTIDGVGTKLKIASAMNQWASVGEDIVNHCSDDILGLGAKPLFFLDYIASDKILPKNIASIVGGMAKACKETGCSIIGGETAEMPGVYSKGEHDIAGCMVGAVEKEKVIDGSKIKEGDSLIGLASNGLHTNGYSLARHVLFEKSGYKPSDFSEELNATYGEELLKVHKSYSKSVLSLAEKIPLKGIAHITGGGLVENVPRIIPKGLKPVFDYSSIEVPEIFSLIQEKGKIAEGEMFRTFNMGVGLVLCVSPENADSAIGFLGSAGEKAWLLGKVSKA